jgi:hypothetical protein
MKVIASGGEKILTPGKMFFVASSKGTEHSLHLFLLMKE